MLSFAGDALICIFPVHTSSSVKPPSIKATTNTTTHTTTTSTTSDRSITIGSKKKVITSIKDACIQATRCALEIIDLQTITLATHIAITCGTIEIALLGGINDEWTYLMNGTCMPDLSSCIDDAGEQEIVCSSNACIHINDNSTFTHIDFIQIEGSGNYYIEYTEEIGYHNTDKESSLVRTNKLAFDRNNKYSIEQIKCNQFVSKLLKSSMIANSTPNSLSEMRKVTTLFISLKPLPQNNQSNNHNRVSEKLGLGQSKSVASEKNEKSEKAIPMCEISPLSFQNMFIYLQILLEKCGGYLRQFLFDDKGCVIIIMFGLPSYTHINNIERAIYFAYEYNKNITKYSYECSIGMSSGICYCGVVGSPIRADYGKTFRSILYTVLLLYTVTIYAYVLYTYPMCIYLYIHTRV